MNAVNIRLAGMQDLEALCRLYVEFHEFHVRGVPDRLRSLGHPEKYDYREMYPRLEKIIKRDDSEIFLAEVGGKPVGLAEVYVREDKPDPARIQRRYGFLQSLIVTEKSRGQGTGKKLLQASEKWAKEKGASEMRLDIWEFPYGPLEFYQRVDYRTLRRTLVRELSPE